MEQLLAISPLDGIYYNNTKILQYYFSEYAFFRYRLYIELHYFVHLCEILKYNISYQDINKIYFNFNLKECCKIKEIESKIKDDVKSIEVYIGNKFQEYNLPYKSLIHFGLTSQDINNTSITLSLLSYIENIYNNYISEIIINLNDKYEKWNTIIMLSKTHGQVSSPTTLGKELYVFSYRLQKELNNLKKIEYYSKFGGTVGNLNAHYSAYPYIDWNDFADKLLNKISINRSKFTTQIDNYENLSIIFDNIKRINTILVDMCQDIWYYISMEYFVKYSNENEVCSSTMPHKINPINFENAEGNLLLSISLLEFLSRKLPISRLQRDLTDSTVLRNLGTVFGYCQISYDNILLGLTNIKPNEIKINQEINNNVIVITEGLQTILRKYGDNNAYNKLKSFCRKNITINIDDIDKFIDDLDVTNECKKELKDITVENYIGNCFHKLSNA
jgi:adenylosuccinate lyase